MSSIPKPTVYIPTLSRYDKLAKVVPLWINQGFKTRLVVDPREYDGHARLIMNMDWMGYVTALPLAKSHQGIGYARRSAVEQAAQVGHKSIILADDDIKPKWDSKMWMLLQEAAKPDVLGVGAVRSIHDQFTGGAVSKLSGPILCPGGWGFQLFGLNIAKAIQLGNFDPQLHTIGEDAELARVGIASGIPWRVHCDVWCAPTGTRYGPGGNTSRFKSPEDRRAAERECLALIHDRWPYYTNAPDNPLRVAWQRMLDHFIPDWKKRSALHGGSL